MRASMIARKAAPVSSWTLANGARIPKIGFGTWKLNKEQAHASVTHALKTGYRHIDSAWAYKNEDATGDAIRKSGIDRKDLWITSKLWNTFHGDKVEAGLDATLQDLGVDYLDLYLMHWPVAFSNPNTSQISSLRSVSGYPVEETKLSQDIAATWRQMEEMVKKGKVRSIGVSNFNIRRTEELLKATTDTNPVINQVEVNFGVPNTELLHYSEAHQIMLQSYSTLGSHINQKKYLEDPIVNDVAGRNNMTPAQALIAWPLARGIVPLTRSTNPAHIEETFAAADKELAWEDVVHLTEESQARPIERSVNPSESWNTEEDIFEDYKDQLMLNSLKTNTFEASRPHEADGSHYFEPRNDPEAPELGPGGTAVRKMHTATSPFARSSRPTVSQQLMRGMRSGRAPFSTSATSQATTTTSSAVESAPPAAEEIPIVGQSVLLRNNAKSASQTPGIKWTDGEEGIERQARKMNMYTVCNQRSLSQQHRAFSSSSVARATPVSAESSGAIASSSRQRVYPERKAFLFGQYKRLLNDSKVSILFQHNNVGVHEMTRIRNDIAAVPVDGADEKKARLTIVRSGLMRKLAKVSSHPSLRKNEHLFIGPIAMLTFDTVSPAYISRILSVADRALKAGRVAPKPALGQPHVKVVSNVNTRFTPLAAIVEQSEGVKKVVDIPSLRDVSALPTLDVLRSQIVGLLSATPARLLATLNQARGGQVALTLDAHRRALDSSSSSAEQSG
ncbi:uncharacterized protein FA14DRAFT_151454 [Meira miltonrushii]|uniref:NADP-dependent oxidoreductase domain-containing protein n=1 Tax=Meira miltonrushii TaxID=1280837 RepID=A0A316V1P4_9BASI|nr:uncharacterized protein FA14DRAFT_151454 [Meira miltonrushii]PWN31469.1 hypothetical protein FA14DRAFT_151454 [Meira miltonrushii]